MSIRGLFAIVVCALAAALGAVHAADVPREAHGSADTFAAPGMALAWGVLRGANESTTTVVIRIVTDPAVFSDVAATGSDPFTLPSNLRLYDDAFAD